MTQDQREFTKSPIPPAITTDEMNRTSRTVPYEVSEDKISILLN